MFHTVFKRENGDQVRVTISISGTTASHFLELKPKGARKWRKLFSTNDSELRALKTPDRFVLAEKRTMELITEDELNLARKNAVDAMAKAVIAHSTCTFI